MAAPVNPLRIYVITGGVAAITATGAWYGAGLKTRQEYKQEVQAALEATPTERLQQMEAAKARLLTQRAELQTKIDGLAAKTGNVGDSERNVPSSAG